MIKVVVFDVGKVIWDYEPFFQALFEAWGQLIGVNVDQIREEFALVYQQFEKDQLELDTWLRKILGPEKVSLAKIIFHRTVDQFFSSGINQPIVDLIKKLKNSNQLIIGSLSNTENFMISIHNRLNELINFDFQILSWQVRVRKPKEKIYQEIFRFGSWRPEEVVFIDDKKKNILGAEKLGIRGILFQDLKSLKSELVSLGLVV